MNGDSRQNRRFGVFLLAAALLHMGLLLIPVVQQTVFRAVPAPVVTVRLQKPAPKPERPEVEPVATPEVPPPEIASAPLPPPRPEPEQRVRPTEPPPVSEPEPEPPVITAHRILSDLAEQRRRNPLTNREPPTEPRALFQAPIGPGLEEVLNEPSLQLPFRDRRIYLVDSYAPGIGGSIDRFFDNVTVPFGFQTKNNTRIQCAWVLILAGCAWGDASLFYAADKARKRVPKEG
jgi:hypothetical protein